MVIPSFQETLDELKIEKINREAWEELWNESQKDFTLDAVFLQKEYVIEQNRLINLIDDVMDMIMVSLEKIRANEYLARMAYHMHYVIFEKKHRLGDTLGPWPDVKNVLGDLN